MIYDDIVWDLDGFKLTNKGKKLNKSDLFRSIHSLFMESEKYSRLMALCLDEYSYTTSEAIYNSYGLLAVDCSPSKVVLHGNSDILFNFDNKKGYEYVVYNLGNKNNFLYISDIEKFKVLFHDVDIYIDRLISKNSYILDAYDRLKQQPYILRELQDIYFFIVMNKYESVNFNFNLSLMYDSKYGIGPAQLYNLDNHHLYYLYELLSKTKSNVNIMFSCLNEFIHCKKSVEILSYLSIYPNLHLYVDNWGRVCEGDSFVVNGKELCTRGSNKELLLPVNSSSKRYIKSLLKSSYYYNGNLSFKDCYKYGYGDRFCINSINSEVGV